MEVTTRRPRILFVGEPVTLAHAVRPLSLAQALDSTRYEVSFACDGRFDTVLGDCSGIRRLPLRSITSKQFMDAAAKAQLAHTSRDYAGYVEDELRLFEQEKPDLVVGDFRHSLAVSAAVAGIPYASITNAYWSPFADPHFRLAHHPAMQWLGERAVDALFALTHPLSLRLFAQRINTLRRRYGLPSIGNHLSHLFSHGDHILFADVPEMVPLRASASVSYSYLGPILWTSPAPKPSFWHELEQRNDVIFVALGSSGNTAALKDVVAGAEAVGRPVIVATSGTTTFQSNSPLTFVTRLVNCHDVLARASLLVCNGGSPMTHLALAHGVPVLGLAGNLDQMLNMDYVEQAGAGVLLRSQHATRQRVAGVCERIVAQSAYKEAAQRIQAIFGRYDAQARFRAFIEQKFPNTIPSSASPPAHFLPSRAAPSN